jgi:hypothetical protein
VGNDRVPIVERQPEELPAATRLAKRPSDKHGLEVARSGQVTSHRTWVQHSYGKDRAAGDQSGETRAYGLDFG